MDLRGKKVAILVAPQFQDEEAIEPKQFLEGHGATVEFIGIKKETLPGKYGRSTVTVSRTFAEVTTDEFDGIIIPGGGAPERLRVADEALSFVSSFWSSGRPVAAICHGPQLLISAGLLKNKRATCYVGIRDDVKLAGALYEDAAVLIDGQLITSRTPEDIPRFNDAFARALLQQYQKTETEGMDAPEALTLAIAREKGACEFYTAVAVKFADESIKNKFNYLATIEGGHFDELSALYKTLSHGAKLDLKRYGIEIGQQSVKDDTTIESAIELAMDAEQHAYEFYLQASRISQSPAGRDMFARLAEEELEHKRLLSVDLAAYRGGRGHFQWATYWDIPPGMDDLW